MVRKKWFVSIILVILTLSVILSGCNTNSNGKAGASVNPTTSVSTNTPTVDNMDKTVDITIVSQTKYAPNSLPNEYTKAVEKKFNMKWDYQAIPLSAGIDKYNVMFASGAYPDMIPSINQWTAVKKWAAGGYLLPIGDYIDKIPNYRKLYTDEQWKMLLSSTSVNGKVYMLPFITTTYDPMTWIYRKDVFDKAGITAFPTTTDEFMTLLLKLKAANPSFIGIGVKGGTGNAGIKSLLYGFDSTFRIPIDLNGANGWSGFWHDPDYDKQLVYAPVTDKQRAMLQYAAKLYKAGLIQKDFPTATDNQFSQNRLNGKDLIDFQYASHVIDLNKTVKDSNWEYAKQYLQADNGGKPPLMFKGPDFALFGSIFSSKLAKEPEKLNRLLQFVNWSATPEGELFNQMGIENLSYVMKDGIPVYKDDLDRKKVLQQFGFDYYLTKSDAAQKGDPIYKLDLEAAPYFKKMPTVLAENAILTEEETNTINTTMTSVWNEVYTFATKAVMGLVDISDDQVWNQYKQDLDKVGLQKALEIYKKEMK